LLTVQSKKMQGIQNLSIEFVKEYKGSKYDEEHLKEKIQKALEVIIPKIASIIKSENGQEPINLWKAIKENGKIDKLFEKSLGEIERPIVIYVASKFKNNRYLGVKIIEEALLNR